MKTNLIARLLPVACAFSLVTLVPSSTQAPPPFDHSLTLAAPIGTVMVVAAQAPPPFDRSLTLAAQIGKAPPQPLSLPLACAGRDCSLLEGAPQTAGMRSGFVRLKPGESVGWHTTGKHEEALVILKGRGQAQIEGQAGRDFTAPRLVYIPPATRHNVVNTGNQPLEYIYVVTPAAGR